MYVWYLGNYIAVFAGWLVCISLLLTILYQHEIMMKMKMIIIIMIIKIVMKIITIIIMIIGMYIGLVLLEI